METFFHVGTVQDEADCEEKHRVCVLGAFQDGAGESAKLCGLTFLQLLLRAGGCSGIYLGEDSVVYICSLLTSQMHCPLFTVFCC